MKKYASLFRLSLLLSLWPWMFLLAYRQYLGMAIVFGAIFILLRVWIAYRVRRYKGELLAHPIEPLSPFSKSIQRVLDQHAVVTPFEIETWSWPEPLNKILLRIEGNKAIWLLSQGALQRLSEENIHAEFIKVVEQISNRQQVQAIQYTQWAMAVAQLLNSLRLNSSRRDPKKLRYWVLTFLLLPLYIKEYEFNQSSTQSSA